MLFYVFVLHLYGQLLLFFVKIASFACASELDHGEGFFARNGTGDVEAGFVPREQLRRYWTRSLHIAGDSQKMRIQCAWHQRLALPQLHPHERHRLFLGVLNVTCRIRNIRGSIFFASAGLSS